LKRGGKRFDATFAVSASAGAQLQQLRETARACAGDTSAAESERLAAVELLSCWPLADVLEMFSLLLDPHEPATLQIAAVRSVGDYPDAELGPWLIARWRAYPPDVRQAVMDVLLAREDRTKALLEAAERGEVSLAQLDASRRQRLLAHGSESIRTWAARVLDQVSSASRSTVIDEYKAALSLERDISVGEQVFRRECMVCHKVGAIGQAVGPDLASSPSRDPETLLTHVLDPNRYVLPNFVQYQVIDTSGRIYTGIMAGQTATSITLQGQEGKSETLLRGNIDELTSTGKSLMPEGLEARIATQEMAHLIGFLQAALPTEPRAEAPLDIGTEPGLVEPPHDPGVENTHRPDQ
jgi:putative heme-binding domain-containing protein